jgi:hypothetical protein
MAASTSAHHWRRLGGSRSVGRPVGSTFSTTLAMAAAMTSCRASTQRWLSSEQCSGSRRSLTDQMRPSSRQRARWLSWVGLSRYGLPLTVRYDLLARPPALRIEPAAKTVVPTRLARVSCPRRTLASSPEPIAQRPVSLRRHLSATEASARGKLNAFV